MNSLISTWPIHRFFLAGQIQKRNDEMIDEYRLKIYLDEEEFLQTVVLPDLLEEYVLGFLVTRRIIKGLQDLSSLTISAGAAHVQRIPSLRGGLPKLTILETTGSSNVSLDHPLSIKTSASEFQVSVKSIINGVGALADMPIFKKTGGTHCAILFSHDGERIIGAEDIGRHNSVDKAIGGGLKKGADFKQCWLAVSGRLPTDMVQKPALVGIPMVASVSAPTLSGVEAGHRTGMTVIGFTREGRLNCYTHPERVLGDPCG